MHSIKWYTGMCGIMVMGLLYILNSMVKCVQMCYKGLGSNGYFMIGTTMIVGSLEDIHY
jgi:hypothetical protein